VSFEDQPTRRLCSNREEITCSFSDIQGPPDVNGASITVPPFHTGHLGFVPGTPVRIGLVNESAGGPHREVVVTPFKKDPRDLAVVTVAMRDQPGVVARLVGAVAVLGLNIEVLESSSIKSLDNHSVTLLVDLSSPSGTGSSDDRTPTAARRLYQGYDSVFPVGNLACMYLFESIVAHCADILEWRTIAGERFPDIEIRGYPENRTHRDYVVRTLVADEKRKLHALIDLPNEIVNGLRQVVSSDGQLEYLVVSDTTTRALHAYFMHPGQAKQVFHVGFFHDDVPGALATILALLREAQFNILTSLVRKQEDGRSVWEAVLQYQGDDEVPGGEKRHAHDPVTQIEIEWICQSVVAAHQRAASEVVDCAIEVAPPKYPLRPKDTPPAERVSLSDLLAPVSGLSQVVPQYEPIKLLDRQLKALSKGQDDGDIEGARQLVRLIKKRHVEHGRPRVFLSYPHSANELAEIVWNRMKRRWRMERYQNPDGEVILEQVIGKIEDCDYFIGIWHPEGSPSKGRIKRISPWMHFEYGVACAAGKPAIVVHSDKLHEDIWRRINPGVANPKYSEVNFRSDTVDVIIDYCERHFV
jgi:acetolactate synthase small subunit